MPSSEGRFNPQTLKLYTGCSHQPFLTARNSTSCLAGLMGPPWVKIVSSSTSFEQSSQLQLNRRGSWTVKASWQFWWFHILDSHSAVLIFKICVRDMYLRKPVQPAPTADILKDPQSSSCRMVSFCGRYETWLMALGIVVWPLRSCCTLMSTHQRISIHANYSNSKEIVQSARDKCDKRFTLMSLW